MARSGKFAKILDFSILAMAAVYFVGFLSFHPESVFLEDAPYDVPHDLEPWFEILLWVFFSALVLDLYLKFEKSDGLRDFFRRHWHDVVLLVMIPVLSAFKVVKLSLKVVKALKAWKSGFKVAYKARKAAKHLKRGPKKHNNR